MFSLFVLSSSLLVFTNANNCDYCVNDQDIDAYETTICCNGINFKNLCFAQCAGIQQPEQTCNYGKCSKTDIDIESLLDHKDNYISYKEEKMLFNIFNKYDLNKDELLSYAEFSIFANVVFKFDEAFENMDINENGKLEYNELVFVFKEYGKSSDIFTQEELKEFEEMYNALETGEEYNGETKAEFLANMVFYEIDNQHNDYITRKEFKKYEVDNEWLKLKSCYNAFINFNEFRNEFFQSSYFTVFKNVRQHENDYGKVQFKYEIQSAHSNQPDMDGDLVFHCHQFDKDLSVYDSKQIDLPRRRLAFWFALGVFVLRVVLTVAVELAFVAIASACYFDHSLVYELNHGLMYIKDLSIGDYVFDGEEYTKIYYIQSYPEDYNTNMVEIKYGNPLFENAIKLTPNHLIYKNGYDVAVTSNNIKVGDVLDGFMDIKDINVTELFEYDNNYTVYDVKLLYNKHPINPITMSGNLMVDGVKTSVFSYSWNEHKRLQTNGAIFRWISDNISEHLAANLINFYYNVIYKKVFANEYVKSIIADNQIFSLSVIFSIPIFLVSIVLKLVGFQVRKIKMA